MSETEETSTETALAEFLFQEIKTYAESDPQGVLLANLGWAVINTKPELKHLLQRYKLGRFIKTRLDGRIDLTATPGKPAEVRVVPKTAHVAAPAAGAPAELIALEAPRQYSRAALIAFTRAIPPAHTRVLNLETPIYFEDVISGELQLKATQVPINEEFVLKMDPPLPPAALKTLNERVDAWLAAQNVALEVLLQQKKRAPAAKTHSSGSLFDALVDSLSPTELRRVQLPLDVIVKLRATQR